MPLMVMEAKDFTSPLFVTRTLEVFLTCTTFSVVASVPPSELSAHHRSTFRTFCMFTWCFFFALTLLIHLLSVVQFHNLVPVSWKNLTVTAAGLGSLMCLSTSVFFPWILMGHREIISARCVAASVSSCLTCLAYAAESYILCTRSAEQRGYMGSTPGLLKILQLWGGLQMIPLAVEVAGGLRGIVDEWQIWVTSFTYSACVLMCLVTLVVILGDCAGRCPVPFDRLMAGFSLVGVLLYMVATVICVTKILQLRELGLNIPNRSPELVIMETVVSSVTLLAYTVDLAFSIKLLCDRVHT